MTTLLFFVFFVLATIIFLVVLMVTRPTKKEVDLGKRLAGIEQASAEEKVAQADILKRDVYSDSPVLEAVLRRLELAADLDAIIKQSDVHWSVGELAIGSVFLLFAVGLLSGIILHSVPIAIFLGFAAALGPYIYLRFKRQARLNKFTAILPDAIDLLSRSLRAGHAVTASIEMVAREVADPVGTEFRRVFEEQNFGLPMREALTNLARRVPVADLQFLVTAMLVQKETGGNLAEVLDKAGNVIHERSRLVGQLRIYTAQGRMTGWILGLLPFLICLLLDFISPSYIHLMFEDPAGRKWIYIGLGLMSIGVWVIRRIVDIKV